MFLILVLAGWISIYASTYDFDQASIFNYEERSGKQLLWIGLSIAIAFIILMLDSNIFDRFAYPLYGLIILLLIATIFLATDVKGSGSWLKLGGGINVQPAEFGKFATALALSKLIGGYQFQLNQLNNYLRVALIIGLPFIIIVLQRETGSALVYAAFTIMLYREGMSGLILFVGLYIATLFITSLKYGDTLNGITQVGDLLVYLIIVVVMILYLFTQTRKQVEGQRIAVSVLSLFIFCYLLSLLGIQINYAYVGLIAALSSLAYLIFLTLRESSKDFLAVIIITIGALLFSLSVDYVFSSILEPHQQTRIKVSLGMQDDPRGVGYNVNQSKIAIGSGGLTGKGFLNGTQTKLKYVPEQDTDFIFCTIGEEEGFLGSLFIVGMFLAFILRLIYLAERQRTVFSRVYGYCVVSIILFHLIINIGMVTGLTPVIGIPLPFFSYGGSSLWGFTILLFIFLRLDLARLERL